MSGLISFLFAYDTQWLSQASLPHWPSWGEEPPICLGEGDTSDQEVYATDSPRLWRVLVAGGCMSPWLKLQPTSRSPQVMPLKPVSSKALVCCRPLLCRVAWRRPHIFCFPWQWALEPSSLPSIPREASADTCCSSQYSTSPQ